MPVFPPPPWEPPTDPAYLRFLGGLKQIASDPKGKVDWKWHPPTGKWWRYELVKWAMEDLGVANTPPDEALSSEGWPTPTWEVREFYGPQLFSKVQKTHGELSQKFPGRNLVWSAMGGGTWRNALERRPNPPTRDENHTGLPRECLERVDRLRLFEQGGYITHDEAQRQVNKIVEECT